MKAGSLSIASLSGEALPVVRCSLNIENPSVVCSFSACAVLLAVSGVFLCRKLLSWFVVCESS
jgi:hypothetical protein